MPAKPWHLGHPYMCEAHALSRLHRCLARTGFPGHLAIFLQFYSRELFLPTPTICWENCDHVCCLMFDGAAQSLHSSSFPFFRHTQAGDLCACKSPSPQCTVDRVACEISARWRPAALPHAVLRALSTEQRPQLEGGSKTLMPKTACLCI